eukprot:scaffold227_cov309-Prasinococcus_capsulatus_cf.AAC.3
MTEDLCPYIESSFDDSGKIISKWGDNVPDMCSGCRFQHQFGGDQATVGIVTFVHQDNLFFGDDDGPIDMKIFCPEQEKFGTTQMSWQAVCRTSVDPAPPADSGWLVPPLPEQSLAEEPAAEGETGNNVVPMVLGITGAILIPAALYGAYKYRKYHSAAAAPAPLASEIELAPSSLEQKI